MLYICIQYSSWNRIIKKNPKEALIFIVLHKYIVALMSKTSDWNVFGHLTSGRRPEILLRLGQLILVLVVEVRLELHQRLNNKQTNKMAAQ